MKSRLTSITRGVAVEARVPTDERGTTYAREPSSEAVSSSVFKVVLFLVCEDAIAHSSHISAYYLSKHFNVSGCHFQFPGVAKEPFISIFLYKCSEVIPGRSPNYELRVHLDHAGRYQGWECYIAAR